MIKALYGLKQASCLWQKKLAKALQDLGFKICISDQSVYYNPETGILVIIYVDDMLIIGKHISIITELKQKLMKRFEIEDLGPASYFVGMRIICHKNLIMLCQDAYIKKILKRYGMINCKPVDMPIIAGATENIILFDDKSTDEDIEVYRSKIGSLTYLAI